MGTVPPPPHRPEPAPTAAREALAGIVYLPLYPELPDRELERMAETVLRHGDRARHPAGWHAVTQDRPRDAARPAHSL
jgi:hypothetical protein